ncbi:MAG: FeoB-associated Cys-rich membrane protein [Bacilli bacterium]
MATIIITALILGYAAYSLFRYVQRTQKGKCAGCSLSKTCDSNCALPQQLNYSTDDKKPLE